MDGPIHPHELPTALDAWPTVKLLSLDCFDTLLWRDVHAPGDMFVALDGLNARQRIWAERAARIEALFRHQRGEVSLPEIYAQLLPNADAATIDRFVAAELAAETAFCFGFAPTIALMRAARDRGLKIIIVSDTYLDRPQLTELIRSSAGDDVLALIDAIYCSSEYGISKANGLLTRVVQTLGVAAHEILHLGDNPVSDFAAARAAGINALHLIQFSNHAEQRLRLEAATSTLIHSRAGPHDLAYQPHRALLAMREPTLGGGARALGYTVLGPVLAGFANWLAAERDQLAGRAGGKVHTLFLMRDGFLPREVFEAVPGRSGTSAAVEISRFTGTAISFTTRETVLRFVEQNVGSGLEYMLRQLLFKPAEIAKILRGLPSGADRSAAFMRTIGAVQAINRILTRSKAMAGRLCAHLRAAVALAPGDTLLLVDLGYNGTVQNLVEPVLRQMLNVEIAGRYVLYRAQQLTGYDKSGFLDERHYDIDTLLALAANVAVLEQLCTIAQGSVVDYAADGRAIRAGSVIKGRQSAVRTEVQDGCIAFARDFGRSMTRPANVNAVEAERRAAAAAIARLMFFPQQHELDVIAQFEHDVNLGTDGIVRLFDPDVADRGMKQRGMFYMKNSERMYLPAELHGQGMPVRLAMLALKRFNLGLNVADFCDRTLTIPILVADGRDVAAQEIVATPTHEGYFVATVPIGPAAFTVAVQFGKLFELVQVSSVCFRPIAAVLSRLVAPGSDMLAAAPTLEGIEATGGDVFRCTDSAGFMMVPPPIGANPGALVLEIVFRPLVARPATADVEHCTAIPIGAQSA